MTADLSSRLTAAILDGEHEQVRHLMKGTTPTDHKALRPVWEKLRGCWDDPTDGRGYAGLRQIAWVAAGAALATTAAQVVTLLRKSLIAGTYPAGFIDVITDREVDWLPEVAERLAQPGVYTLLWQEIITELRVHTGMPHPRTPNYLRDMCFRFKYMDRAPLLERLRADKAMLDAVPDMLEVPDIGAAAEGTSQILLDDQFVDTPPEYLWHDAIAALAHEAVPDRDVLIDQVLRVLLRGGKRNHIAFFLQLHAGLALTAAEVGARFRSYTQLVANGPAVAAKMAQQALFDAYAAGVTGATAILDISRSVLARTEKGLVTAQLKWLAKCAEQSPALAGDIARATVTALEHEKQDIQERALQLLDRIVPLPDDVRSAVDLLVDQLPLAISPLAARLTGRSAESVVPELPADPSLFAPLPVAEMPPPPATPAEFAHIASALLETDDPLLGEQLLATLPHPKPADLRAALAVLAPRIAALIERPPRLSPWPVLLAHCQNDGALVRQSPDWAPNADEWLRVVIASGPGAALRARIADAIMGDSGSHLVAHPTSTTGAIDPAALLLRLSTTDHARMSEIALQQALLRLPRDIDAAFLAELRELDTPAARWLAARLDDGPLADPEVELYVERIWPMDPKERLLVRLRPSAWTSGLALVDLACTLPDAKEVAREEGRVSTWFAGALHALPNHREVVAAAAVPMACGLNARLGDNIRQLITGLPAAAGRPDRPGNCTAARLRGSLTRRGRPNRRSGRLAGFRIHEGT